NSTCLVYGSQRSTLGVLNQVVDEHLGNLLSVLLQDGSHSRVFISDTKRIHVVIVHGLLDKIFGVLNLAIAGARLIGDATSGISERFDNRLNVTILTIEQRQHFVKLLSL